jgi:cytochrome c-type biogenesis protein CcmH/NrfG
MRKGPIILTILFLAIGAALYFAPRAPKVAVATDEIASTPSGDTTQYQTLDEKVEAAVTIIRSAEGAPMAGIQMLREVVAEDPTHLAAHYFLGEFSVMSGQYDKAIERFQTVMTLDSLNLPGLRYLAIAYSENQQPEQALAVLDAFLAQNPELPSIEEVKELRDYIANEASSKK